MPNIDKADRRDSQRHKKHQGMRVSGRSLKDIVRLQKDRAAKPDPHCEECEGTGETTFKVGAIESKGTCPCVRR